MKGDLKIEEVFLSAIYPDPSNSRKHSKKNLNAIQGSLSKFGQVEPLVVQSATGVVVGGNGRLEAMRALGWETCKVVKIDIDDSQAIALSIALNRTAELAEWDDEILKAQLGSLDEELRAVAYFNFELPEEKPEPSEDDEGKKKSKTCPNCGELI